MDPNGSIWQRADGRWGVAHPSHSGPPWQTTRATKPQAQSELRRYQARWRVGLVRTQDTVADLIDTWFIHKKTVDGTGPDALANYRRELDKLPVWIRNVPVAELRAADVERAIAELDVTELSNGRRIARSTVVRTLQSLRHALDRAVVADVIASNPAAAISVPRRDSIEAAALLPSALDRNASDDDWLPGRGLSPETARAMISAHEGHRLQSMWHVAIQCGLRRGELAGLCWGDLLLDRNLLRVRRQIRRVEGLPGLTVRLPKGGKTRAVGLPDSVVVALRSYREMWPQDRRPPRPPQPDDPVWPAARRGSLRHGGGWMGPDNIDRRWRLVRDRLGLRGRLHDARHASVRVARGSGAPDHVIKAAHGHQTDEMLEHYGPADVRALQQLAYETEEWWLPEADAQ